MYRLVFDATADRFLIADVIVMEMDMRILLALWSLKYIICLPDAISIGGLFHPADDKQEIAFRYAVEKINSDRSILPRSKLSAQIEKIPPQDSFHASKKGMVAIILF
ncbi:hypothetical protein JTB14_018111 [Gonioctena quinquepunctata]|nr:hypothetical protein JTB14_018111 [Gonioctena quinquepunctata]